MVVIDRNGNSTMQVAKIGRIDTESIKNTIGNLVDSVNVLCSDSYPSIVAWAKEKQLGHNTFIASKQHVKS